MKITFSKIAWEEYISWQANNKKIVKRINLLIKDILRNPFDGIGKPEPLKYDLVGFWSRRITLDHRLVYQFHDNNVLIYSCQYHYDDHPHRYIEASN